ncbi:hypothetical protein INT46_010516 [Mucor plumbeus]|uniref:Uncharacterized protein n=1 Tax=Mucor plumbeus TaxID=97098 RepID=A0A8H7RG78_9FUNG|nr:hypothetical protein INT46_010516 [Mucor plumbeus]
MSQASSETSFYDLEYVSTVARRINIAVDKKELTSVNGKKRPVTVFSEANKKSKCVGFSGRSNSSDPGAQGVKFVKTMQEHIAESTFKKFNMHCVWGHTFGTAVRSVPDDSKVVRSMSKLHSVKVAVNAAILSANVDQAVADSETSSSHAPVFNTRGIVVFAHIMYLKS